jgi:tetratricopeptide (TPR) repeat protein
MTTKKISAIIFVVLLFLVMNAVLVRGENKNDEKLIKKSEKYRKKGDKSLKKKKIDKAIEYYHKSLELYDNNKKTNNNMGIAYIQKQDYKKAITFFEKAVKIDKTYTGAKKNLARALLFLSNQEQRAGNKKKWAEYLEKSLNYIDFKKNNEKTIVNIHYSLALYYFSLKKSDEAIKHLMKMMEIPDFSLQFPKLSVFVNYLIGVNYHALKKYDDSTKYLHQYIELTKHNQQDKWLSLAYYLLGENNFRKLEKEVKEKIESNKKNDVVKIKDLSLKYKGKIEPYLIKAIELNNKIENAYTDLGNYYYFIQNYNKAIEIYEKLILNFPNSPEINNYKNFKEKLLKIKQKK